MQDGRNSLREPGARWTDFAPLILFIAIAAVYANSLRGEFISDDIWYFATNTRIRTIWPLYQWDWHADYASLRTRMQVLETRPVARFTFALNYAWGKTNVWGYHAVNIFLHGLTATALWGLIRATLVSPRLKARYGARAGGLALAIALIWSLHPIQSEAVCFTTQRSEELVGLFLWLLFYCVGRRHGSPHRLIWELGGICVCALGMGSKQSFIAAPVLALLYDRTFFSPTFSQALKEHRTLYLGLVLTWLFLLMTFPLPALLSYSSKSADLHNISSWDSIKTQGGVLMHYIQLALWPHPLVVNYDGWPIGDPLLRVLPFMATMTALFALTVWAVCRRSPWGFIGAVFFLILAPTSSFFTLPSEIAAERRMYQPLASVTVVFVFAMKSVAERLEKQGVVSGVGIRRLVQGGTLALCAALALSTIHRNPIYQNMVSFTRDVTEKHPNNISQTGIWAEHLMKERRVEEAIEVYQRFLRFQPDDPFATNNMGLALADMGRIDEAVAHYRHSLEVDSSRGQVHNNLALALVRQGHVDEAIREYRRALELDYDSIDAHNNLANALLLKGQTDEAIKHLNIALRLEPNYAEAHTNLANVLLREGKAEEAVGHYEKALKIEPNYPEVHFNLANVLKKLNRVDEAIRHYSEAVRLKPEWADAHYNLGVALLEQNKEEEAILQFKETVRINPKDIGAHYMLGNIGLLQGKFAEAERDFLDVLKIQPDYKDAKEKLEQIRKQKGQTPSGP